MVEWFTLDEARSRTGLHPDTLRKQIRKGEREGRKDNHGRWLVRIDPDEPGLLPGPARSEAHPGHPDLARALAERDVHIARLEERLAAVDELKAELRRMVDQARADVERERRRAEETERRQAEQDRRLDDVLRELREERRRPWPGLRRWWRRVWEGEG